MSGFKVEQIALDAQEAEQVTALINRSFPENRDIGVSRIKENTEVSGDRPSIYVAAKIGSEIIGFNAFIAHRLWLNGEPILAYQSCWTATSDQHRSKGIFQQLINGGREMARARGAAFLFGFPNRKSRPIMVHKLHFREVPSMRWRMPLVPFARRLWTGASASLALADSLFQDEASLMELKRRAYGKDLIELRSGKSMMWGTKRSGGRSGLPLFDIGGIDLKRSEDFGPIFDNLIHAARGCAAAQFFAVEGSRYLPFFRHLRAVDPPFEVSDLNLATAGLRFSFFSGIRDYF